MMLNALRLESCIAGTFYYHFYSIYLVTFNPIFKSFNFLSWLKFPFSIKNKKKKHTHIKKKVFHKGVIVAYSFKVEIANYN